MNDLMNEPQKLEGVYEVGVAAWDLTPRETLEPGEWTVLLFNNGKHFVANAPYAWRGMSLEQARRFLRARVKACLGGSTLWEKVSKYAYIGTSAWNDHAVYCMTDQEIAFPVRELNINQRVF